MSGARRVLTAAWIAVTIVGPIVGPRFSIDVGLPLGLGAAATATIGHAVRIFR